MGIVVDEMLNDRSTVMIGTGMAAEVFKAKMPSSNKWAAVKVFFFSFLMCWSRGVCSLFLFLFWRGGGSTCGLTWSCH